MEEEEAGERELGDGGGAGYSCFQPVLTVLIWAPNDINIKIQ